MAAALAVPGAHLHLYDKAEVRPGRKMGHVTALGDDARGRPRPRAARRGGGGPVSAATGPPLVGVVMGSDSDLPVVGGAGDVLSELGVPHEVRVVSAHRTPHDMIAYGGQAADRGLRGASSPAPAAPPTCPGCSPRSRPCPVIGVPVRGSALDGIDSLLSIVQMPRGVPVATVAIDGGRNAGLLAAQILALSDPSSPGAWRRARRDGRGRRDAPTRRCATARVGGDAGGGPTGEGAARAAWTT